MFVNYTKFKLKSFNHPKSIILKIDNFLDKNFLKTINEEIILLSNIKTFKKFYLKRKSNKIEFLDYSIFYKNSKKLIKILSQKKFINFLQKNLNIKDNLYPDASNGFSGFNIVKKNGFLKTHADFNYNNYLKKYRTINLLIYFNRGWKKNYGGNLSFYDYSSNKKQYTFIAKNNRCLIFLTNKFTPHGYKKIVVDKDRVSLNFYYYTKKNFSHSLSPHKTLWR
jgi:Rps23 Pro-64 3,4-dihydroxylase Tpa1-like proline 4-hydroxylase